MEVCGNITHVKNNGGGNKAKGGDGGGGSRGLKPEEKRGCWNHSFTLDIICCSSAGVPGWDGEEGRLVSASQWRYLGKKTH